MSIIILVLAIVLIIIIWKIYTIKYDTIIGFTGGLGSGKSLLSVTYSLRLLRKNSWKVFRHNYIWKYVKFWKLKSFQKWEQPQLYSSIPISYYRHIFSRKKEFSIELTDDHLLLQKRIVPRSVVFIDEIGSYCNQYEYRNPNATGSFDEFVRLFRHYTLGGYMVVNDQCSENIVLTIRRRINQVFNLMHFKKWFGIFYTVKIRNINISEEIKTIEELNSEDNMKTSFGILLGKKKLYDTYCYSNRYKTVPSEEEKRYTKLKKMKLLTIPKEKFVAKTTDKED